MEAKEPWSLTMLLLACPSCLVLFWHCQSIHSGLLQLVVWGREAGQLTSLPCCLLLLRRTNGSLRGNDSCQDPEVIWTFYCGIKTSCLFLGGFLFFFLLKFQSLQASTPVGHFLLVMWWQKKPGLFGLQLPRFCWGFNSSSELCEMKHLKATWRSLVALLVLRASVSAGQRSWLLLGGGMSVFWPQFVHLHPSLPPSPPSCWCSHQPWSPSWRSWELRGTESVGAQD